MLLNVSSLSGLAGIPNHRTPVRKWISRNNIPISFGQSSGGPCEMVSLSSPGNGQAKIAERTFAGLRV